MTHSLKNPECLAHLFTTLVPAVAVTALFGMALSGYLPETSPTEGALQMLAIAGSGWLLQMLAALILLRQSWQDYFHALFGIMRLGVVALLPATVLLLLAPALSIWIPILSVAISSGLMLLFHQLEIRKLGLSTRWTLSWFVALQSTAVAWLAIFFL